MEKMSITNMTELADLFQGNTVVRAEYRSAKIRFVDGVESVIEKVFSGSIIPVAITSGQWNNAITFGPITKYLFLSDEPFSSIFHSGGALFTPIYVALQGIGDPDPRDTMTNRSKWVVQENLHCFSFSKQVVDLEYDDDDCI